eukprot:31505-Pelagococcus_subviridis.AAC.7
MSVEFVAGVSPSAAPRAAAADASEPQSTTGTGFRGVCDDFVVRLLELRDEVHGVRRRRRRGVAETGSRVLADGHVVHAERAHVDDGERGVVHGHVDERLALLAQVGELRADLYGLRRQRLVLREHFVVLGRVFRDFLHDRGAFERRALFARRRYSIGAVDSAVHSIEIHTGFCHNNDVILRRAVRRGELVDLHERAVVGVLLEHVHGPGVGPLVVVIYRADDDGGAAYRDGVAEVIGRLVVLRDEYMLLLAAVSLLFISFEAVGEQHDGDGAGCS